MNISIKKYITDAIKHRYLTDVDVSTEELSGRIVDATVPTYMADHNTADNYGAYCISPMNASLMNTSQIPFNKLIKISGVDMKRVQKAMKAIKKKELTFVSVGYGGLSINVLLFMSMFGYRSGVNEMFKNLHVFEKDNISFTNSMRLYKDLTNIKCRLEDRLVKTDLFSEGNLASNILLHQYYLNEETLSSVEEDAIFFGAPDFETRDLLMEKDFIFGGHTGDSVTLFSRPKIDASLTRETYGTINLSSFFINMMKVTERLLYELAEGKTRKEDEMIFEYNAKKDIERRFEKVAMMDKGLSAYKVENDLEIII